MIFLLKLVAGCLITFACRLSFIHGEGDYKGWLAFDGEIKNELLEMEREKKKVKEYEKYDYRHLLVANESKGIGVGVD